MKLAFIAVLASLAAMPVAAEDIAAEDFTPNWDLDFAQDGLINEIAYGSWTYEGLSTPKPEAMFNGFSAKGLDFKLFDQPLTTFQNVFGGSIQEKWSAGYHHLWLCYTSGGQRIWYITDFTDGNDGEHVGWIVQEPSNPKTDASYGCTEQPLALLTQPQDFPAIGATLDEVNKHFGTIYAIGATHASYQVMEDSSRTRTAYYRFSEGVVDAVSFSQWEYLE